MRTFWTGIPGSGSIKKNSKKGETDEKDIHSFPLFLLLVELQL